ncbi:MAG TPA: radical SAM protein, partial [Methanosarcinales archaeon]|nr:radical SAM protein [Methanosarcinales archaeon]
MQTKSLCPECKKVIDTTVYEKNGQVLLDKTCAEHGTFRDVYWSDAALYSRFAGFWHDGTGVDNPMTERDKGCPYDCGLCPEHKTTTVLSLIDVTNRCNMRCPVCFANAAAAGYVYEPSVEQIREMMQLLIREKPVRNWAIQFSGGEPTVRDDLPVLVRMAHNLDFVQIQIATNGVRLARSVEYCRELVEAGLHTVYLQFDGITPEPYLHIRGFNALPTKQRVIENCREAGIKSITLVPTLIRGVNDDQIGGMIRFASENLDVVKGVNIQPVSFAGRIDQKDREEWRITIPDAFRCIEEQTDYEITRDDFYPVPCVVPISNFGEVKKGEPQVRFTMHPHCGAGTYVYVENGRYIPITHFIDVEGLFEYLDEVALKYDHKTINKLHVSTASISHITR